MTSDSTMQVRIQNRRRRLHASPAAARKGPQFVFRNGRLVRNKAPQAEETDQVETPEVVVTHEIDPETPLTTGRKVAIAVFIVSLLLPVSVNLGSLRLTPPVLFLLLAFIPATAIWLFARPTRVTAPDYLIAGSALWGALALAVNHGFMPMIEPIGLLIVQMLGAFILGRVLVRDDKSMMFMAKVVVIAACALLVPAVIEAISGRAVILDTVRMVAPTFTEVDMEPRMGIRRAQASFEHPILFGVFAASLLSLAVYCLPRTRFWRRFAPPAVVLTALPSLSAGPLLALNAQFGLMVWARVFRNNPKRWRNLAILLVLLYVLIDLVSERTPFHVLVNYATFSSGSAYTRILIWEFGSAEALRHPIFGIGQGDWERPAYMSSSIDNFWLMQAMTYGMPSCFLLMGGVAVILWRARRAVGPDESRDRLRRGAIFSLLGTCVAMGTVHLWNAVFMWFMFLTGASVWLGLSRQTLGAARTSRNRDA